MAGMGGSRASIEDIARLRKSMADLETMLADVECVSSVLNFEGAADGSERSTFRTADTGPAVLAAEVGEELTKWREVKNEEFLRECAANLKRLEDTARARQAEERARETVRMLVRRRLFTLANSTLRTTVEQRKRGDVLPRPTIRATDLNINAGASIEALSKLRYKLAEVVQSVLNLRADPPPEMQQAVQASAAALQRKGERGSTRAGRLPEIAAQMDTQLLEHAEASATARRKVLTVQFERQLGLMDRLREAATDREESLEDPDGQPNGNVLERTKASPWRTLWPSGNVQLDDQLSADPRPRAPPQLFPGMEDQMADNLRRTLLEHGEARVRDICAEIHTNYIADTSILRTRVAGFELERWQLSSKIQLLEDILAVSEENHRTTLGQLKNALNSGADDHVGQLNRTLSATEDFHEKKTKAMKDQLEKAEDGLKKYIDKFGIQTAATRRCVEIGSLKRSVHDIGGVEATQQKLDRSCLRQLAEASRQLVSDVHTALPLSLDSYSLGKCSPSAELLISACQRANVHVTQQMALTEKICANMPNTVDSCAVAKVALSVADNEIHRLIRERLTHRDC